MEGHLKRSHNSFALADELNDLLLFTFCKQILIHESPSQSGYNKDDATLTVDDRLKVYSSILFVHMKSHCYASILNVV